MRYIFVSDIHGQFDRLLEALDAAKFDINNDTIVSLGDPFDRGPQSWEVLEFLMGCPNRILIWGNHDLRLRELMIGCQEHKNDYHNGVLDTMKSFCDNFKLQWIAVGVRQFLSDDKLKSRRDLLWQYFAECHFAIEFKDIVGTHAWIPVGIEGSVKWVGGLPSKPIKYQYVENWREAHREFWVDAAWEHTETMMDQEVFIPNKTLVVGHWHAWRLNLRYSKNNWRSVNEVPFDTYNYKNKVIAIDGCSNAAEGKVNTFVYETDEAPVLIDGTR